MRRVTLLFGLGLCSLLVLSGASCGRPSNPTSEKGPGGLPKQQFDSSDNVIPWEIPEELHYANWTQMYPDNNRIYLVADSPEVVAKWYLEKLPNANREDINGKRHIKVKNKEIEVDIEQGDAQTKIAISPLTLGLSHK